MGFFYRIFSLCGVLSCFEGNMEFARCPPSFFHLSFSLHHFWREADYDGEEGNEGGYGRRRREEKEEGGRGRMANFLLSV